MEILPGPVLQINIEDGKQILKTLKLIHLLVRKPFELTIYLKSKNSKMCTI